MIETIRSYETMDEAFYAIELFEARSKVSVVILDEQGNPVWPAEGTVVTEDILDNGVVEQVYMSDIISSYEKSAEQIISAQESNTAVENAAIEDRITGDEAISQGIAIRQEDVVTQEAAGQADGMAETGDNSAVKRYSVTVGGEPIQ